MPRNAPWLLVGSACLLLAPALAAKAPLAAQMGALPDGALASLGPPRLMHHARISSLAFSPDGRTVYASASLLRVQSALGEQQAIRAWDVRTGKLLRQFGGPRWGVLSLALSPDGRSLASVGGDGAVDVWDIATAKRRGRLRAPLEGNCVSGVAYSGDGKLLACCGLDVRVWDAATGRLLHLFGQEGMYHALAFAPDRKSLVTTTYADTKVSFWDVAKGKRLRRVEGPTSACPSFAAGGLLALGGEEGEAQLWRPAEGKPSRKLGGTSDEVLYGPCVVALSRDGKLLAWGAERGVIRLWDVARARERPPLLGHAKAVTALAFSPDGTILASGGLDREVRLWDAATGRQRFAGAGHAGALTALSFARDGTLATAGEDGSVRVWSPTGTQAHHFQGHKGPVSSVAFLGAGRRLVSGGEDGTIRFWDTARGKASAPLGVKQAVQVLGASSGGGLLAAGLKGGQLRMWRLEGEAAHELSKPALGWNKGLALSPNGNDFATVGLAVGSKSGGTSVQLRDVKGDSLVRQFLAGTRGDFGPLAFSADGSRLAVVHQQDEEAPAIVLYRVQTGQELARLRGPARRIRAIAFSPDGRALAAGGADGVVHLWEAATGQEVRRFEGHLDEITCVAFAPDGKALASGGRDRRGYVWARSGLRPGAGPRPLPAKELEDCWKGLSASPASFADRCLWRLVAAADQTVPLLKAGLRPVATVAADRRARLIDALDDERFDVRTRAHEELSRLAEGAEEALRKAAAAHVSLEVRMRARKLLDELAAPTPERLREIRAVAVLEYAGTAKARQLLLELSRGEPKARLTADAKASLARLGR